MSFIDSIPSAGQSLKRLEEFSTFNSCIKCFGKSILPPLLTSERREEARLYREAATKIQEAKEKKKKLHCAPDERHLAACDKNDFVMHNNTFENKHSALLATTVIDIQACPPNVGRNFSNEMHISTCKIASSNICSTVHKDVILFTSVKANNDTKHLSKSDTTIPNCYSDQMETPLALDNAYSSVVNNQQDLRPIVPPLPCKSASNTSAEYLPKIDTNCSTSVFKHKSEAQLTLRNTDLCEDRNQRNLHYSVHVMPYITVPDSNTEYIYKSDEKCIQGPIQLNNTDFYESNNEQNLPHYFPESNSKCPSHSDQDDPQFSLENTEPCKDSNGQKMSFLVSATPYASGPTNDIPSVGGPTVEMPYLSRPTIEMSHRSGPTVEISDGMGPTVKLPYESVPTMEMSHGMGPTAEMSLESGSTIDMPYGSCLTMEMPYGSGPTAMSSHRMGPVMKLPYGSGPAAEMSHGSCPTVAMPLGIGPGVEMPHYPTEEMASVSEDEHDSNTESLEFGSLPTVISAGHFPLPQDTDDESNVTCLTQSTDLERYLDCSIEYSSPEDAGTLSRSQVSSRLNMSTRSDDASSQVSSRLNMSTRSDDASSGTLVNTGSETTPCASAMAILTYAGSDIVENHLEEFISDAVANQRAISVDSYMLKARSKELPIRKSQSEPCNSEESKQFPAEINLESIALDLKNTAGDSNQETGPISESEVFLSFEDVKKSLKRKHVRSNSYTLEQPSPALIMAHADCNCSQDPNNLSPHSCSSEKLNFSTPNLAFRKEKVNIDLPSLQDRKKFFPILSSTSAVVNGTNANNKIIDAQRLNVADQPEVKLAEVGYENLNRDKNTSELAEISSVEESQLQDLTEYFSKEHTEVPSETNNSDASIQRLSQQTEEMSVSPDNISEMKNSNINDIVNRVICDMKELQKNRVSQFFEDQNKLWLQMQEEFKEQERLLCEKLNAVNIAPKSNVALPHGIEMNGAQHPVIENSVPVTNSNKVTNLKEGDNSPCLNSSCDKTSEMESFEKSNFNYIPTDASKNFQNPELPNEDMPDSKSTTSLPSATNNMEESKSPMPPKRSSSLSAFDHSQPADSCDGSVSVQSSLSSKFLNAQSQDSSSDYPETIHSGMSSKSLNTNSQDLSSENPETMCYRMSPPKSSNTQSLSGAKQETVYSRMSSESLNTNSQDLSNENPETRYYRTSSKSSNTQSLLSENQETIHSSISSRSLNTQILDLLSEKRGTIHSGISETSVDADSKASVETMQSLYNNCPISQLSVPEGSYSSMSFRSVSSLSQTSDMAKMFRDFRFANENNSSSASPGKVCQNQEHRGRESICSECCSGSKCNSFARRLYFDNLSDDGDRFFTTPISPSEFIPSPAVFQQQKSLTSTTLLAMRYQGPDVAAMNLKNNNSCDLGALDLISSETVSSGQENLSNNNTVPKVSQNLNNVPETNTQDNKSCGEAEIRALNDLVQSSYASSYNEKGRKGPAPSNNLNKSHGREQKSHGSSDIPFNATSSVEKGALKQNISSSMTNLKRRQSRDVLKDPALLKKFERLPALVRGYLTRRLFNSERVQDLIRTLRDTALLVGKCSQELNSKGNSVSENDVEFHRRLIAQLMRSFEDVYDIFCTISVGEQMKIIEESRNLRLKKSKAAKNESAAVVTAEKCHSSPSKKPKLSSATMKALERKRSSIHSRTYIVEDMKRNKSRVSSNTNTKSHALSPSRVYKTSVITPMKRKTFSGLVKPSWK